jgi:hypothetical protein
MTTGNRALLNLLHAFRLDRYACFRVHNFGLPALIWRRITPSSKSQESFATKWTKLFCCSTAAREVWAAKALCEWDEDSKTMQMPEWLALEKGLI